MSSGFSYRRYKRIFDLVIAVPALIIIAPLLVLIAFSVWVTLGKPVLWREVRPGLNAIPFTLLKFRTMTHQHDEAGNLLPDSERLTSFGRFLRSTSLDELPELLNVLAGDMSLVGPRPLMMKYLDRYTPEQNRRHLVHPGITGLAQIRGRNLISWEEKFDFDIWYVNHQSLLLDLKIIAITIWKIIAREGITAKGHVTAPEFQGSRRS